jgi:hypothetical protein
MEQKKLSKVSLIKYLQGQILSKMMIQDQLDEEITHLELRLAKLERPGLKDK